jgi:hypothetical protein
LGSVSRDPRRVARRSRVSNAGSLIWMAIPQRRRDRSTLVLLQLSSRSLRSPKNLNIPTQGVRSRRTRVTITGRGGVSITRLVPRPHGRSGLHSGAFAQFHDTRGGPPLSCRLGLDQLRSSSYQLSRVCFLC